MTIAGVGRIPREGRIFEIRIVAKVGRVGRRQAAGQMVRDAGRRDDRSHVPTPGAGYHFIEGEGRDFGDGGRGRLGDIGSGGSWEDGGLGRLSIHLPNQAGDAAEHGNLGDAHESGAHEFAFLERVEFRP